jgi:hypothetical protein
LESWKCFVPLDTAWTHGTNIADRRKPCQEEESIFNATHCGLCYHSALPRRKSQRRIFQAAPPHPRQRFTGPDSITMLAIYLTPAI